MIEVIWQSNFLLLPSPGVSSLECRLKMASQTQGIQQLLAAEKRAAEKVAEAKKSKYKIIYQVHVTLCLNIKPFYSVFLKGETHFWPIVWVSSKVGSFKILIISKYPLFNHALKDCTYLFSRRGLISSLYVVLLNATGQELCANSHRPSRPRLG